jgi:hypothetical protein
MSRSRELLAALLLALAACGDEDRTQTRYTPSADKNSTSADDTTAVPARAIQGPDTVPKAAPPQDTFALALAPLRPAGLRGSGQAAAAGKATAISVTLAEGHPGASYAGAVRRGVCGAMGAEVASLNPVSTDLRGRGQASSDIPVPVDSLTGSPHVMVYGPGGRPEACGVLAAGPARS